VEVKDEYQVKILSRFATSENLDDDDDGNYVDISRALESIRENVKASATESLHYYGLKQHKPWFNEE
jgi:hypothetical protein